MFEHFQHKMHGIEKQITKSLQKLFHGRIESFRAYFEDSESRIYIENVTMFRRLKSMSLELQKFENFANF